MNCSLNVKANIKERLEIFTSVCNFQNFSLLLYSGDSNIETTLCGVEYVS